MSNHYSAVGWNRQKKRYDGLLFGFCLLYLGSFIGILALNNPEYTFETALIRASSTLALLLLHLILAIGPLSRLQPFFLPFLYNRRHLGVTMFIIALIHGAFSLFQFHALGNINPLLSLFTTNTRYGSISQFPFQALGFLALVIFCLMAVTSHDFWLKQLGPRVWKTLHMMVYLAYFLVIMHALLGVLQFETHPFFFCILLLGAFSLTTLHLLAAYRESRVDHRPFTRVQEGWVFLCLYDDIVEGRAKIFCVKEERIAVYKHQGQIFGIHNVCKHQGGPLGEGKILDGCITCPWHGYQYLPHNGQSPPPFQEKVSTYDIHLNGNEVWINPLPYPEGTEIKKT